MNDESLSDQVKEVYANFGLAIYHAQCLEHALVNALVFTDFLPSNSTIRRSRAEWSELIDSFMDSKFELTLGKLIHALTRGVAIEPPLHLQLAGALEKRNWLAHHYFRERAEKFLTFSGRAEMLLELEDAQNVFSQADEALESALKPAREKFGVTDQVLSVIYAKLRSEVHE